MTQTCDAALTSAEVDPRVSKHPGPPRSTVYLDVWTGDSVRARNLVEAKYPNAKLVQLNHRELRQGSARARIRLLRSLKGAAAVFYFNSFRDSKYTELILWSGLLHGCSETALVDRDGEWRIYRRKDWFWLFPKTAFLVLLDGAVLAGWWIYLRWLLLSARPQKFATSANSTVAYLFPYCLHDVHSGGAASHIRGFLTGLAETGSECRIFTGTTLPVTVFPQNQIPASTSSFVLWEALALSYNRAFTRRVQRLLGRERPAFLYQRHGRFSVAAAMLSRKLGVPFVLEYNGSEAWMSTCWDPARFYSWLKVAEDVALRSATFIAVTSEASKNELLKFGLPVSRILVNPNGVNPEVFRPACGGDRLRRELKIGSQEVVVGFVGSFSFWHGIAVMQQAIAEILGQARPERVRFLLVGEGPLYAEARAYLKDFEARGQVIFTGIVPHDQVPMYLDAADILMSPHVPNEDGTPFFGSPTKLFEYMAMGKAIAASNLDQLATVLTHNETAILTKPGSVEELARAILLLASDSVLRERLGHRAREIAIERHTWKRNAANVLAFTTQRNLHA